jgi:hypothetical protein
LELTGEAVVRRCLTIRGFHNYAPAHLRFGVEFLARQANAHPWERLVSPAFALEELSAAFAEARTQRWARVAVKP